MKSSFRISQSPSLFQVMNLYPLLLFILFSFLCRAYGSSAKFSYNDHCASVVPESSSTVRAQMDDIPELQTWTSYYTGGENIFGRASSAFAQHLYNSSRSLSFYATRNVYETNTAGVYKVQAYLKFQVPVSRFSNYSNLDVYRRSRSRRRRQGVFLLDGFWSESTRKLCMVGSASWQSEAGASLELLAVLRLQYAPEKSTIFTGIVKGTLESLSPSEDSNHFQLVKIVSFPLIRKYSYTLASKEPGGGCLGGINVQASQSLSFKSRKICSYLYAQPYDFVLDYASGCKDQKNCSPLQRDVSYLHQVMSLSAIQCSEEEEKLRYIIAFSNNTNRWPYNSLDPKTTLIGEGSWQRKKNQMCIVACRILYPTSSPGDAHVGDCSIRMSFRFPAVWTVNNASSILGEIWTNNPANSPGYFGKIMLRSSTDNGWRLPGLKYEYTEVNKARETCFGKKPATRGGREYPKGNSYEMRLQMSIKHSGEYIGWGDAEPVAVGDDFYQGNRVFISEWGEEGHVNLISEDEEYPNATSPMNISYKIILYNIVFKTQFSSLNYSMNPTGSLVIIAEGVYDAERGAICMVGCRELYSYNQKPINQSLDCQILVNFEFPPVNSRGRSYIEGTIQSRRPKSDPLYFDQLNISSYFYSVNQAEESIRRVDLEIIMVLISNSLSCIFVVFQIFHVKKHPQNLPFISIAMLIILTLGHFIPLVLNFEALILKNRYHHNEIFRGSGWLEVNEMSVRLVIMAAFLFLSRLLQLAWTARLGDGNNNHSWSAEKRVLLVSLPLYIAGGLITILVSLKSKNGDANPMLSSTIADYQRGFDSEYQSSTLKYLRSYAGLIVDGFLFPQILLNMFLSSKESALSKPFYMGTTLVRLLPHAYDLYWIQNFIHLDFNESYIYANPNADFYSIAWDVIIPCGCILFSVIIWLQQRFGGRYILPHKLRELELYEKVPVVDTE